MSRPKQLPSGAMASIDVDRLQVEQLRKLHWYDVTDGVEVVFPEPPRAVLCAQCVLTPRVYLLALFPSGPRELWTERGNEGWHRVQLSQDELKMVWDHVRTAARRNAAREAS